MDCARGTRFAAVALTAFLLAVGPSSAEVKLRIYLQDGSLQSGTLVTETDKSFVVMTQQGRVEVPKSSIMFVNGKTLKQWQDRPDKLFQTEIIPTDIPNPAYVNDKSLPPPPPIPDLPKSVTPPAAAEKPAPARKAVRAAAEAEKKAVRPETTAASAEKKSDVASAPKKERPVRHRTPAAAPALAAAPAPVKPPKTSSPERPASAATPASAAALSSGEPSDPGAVLRRARFDRQTDGERHYQKALEFERAGETGRAIQEFQFARLLTPGNADVPLQLARLCLAQGLTEQAKHYFSHPLLRRNDEATAQIARIDSDRAEREEHEWRWKVGATAGCFAWLPFVVALRLLRRRRKPAAGRTTITADDLRPEEWLPEAAREMASPVPPAPTFEVIAPAPLEEAAPEPAAPEEAPRAPEPPKVFPGLPEFLKNLTASKSVPPAPVVPEPAPETPAEVPPPAWEEPPFVAPEPVLETPAVKEPAPPAPVPEPVAAEPVAPMPSPDPTEILSLARTMEASLVRGNQYAVEGRVEEARRAYRTALVFNPSCASAHLGLGYLSFCEEKWETSLLHYRKALEIDPMSADAHYGVARVLLEINRIDDALPELRATLQIDPTYDDARDTLTALSKPA